MATARYDEIAGWYREVTEGWYAEPVALLPEELAGHRVLDLACGQGNVARLLASRGATVVGLDLSAGMLGIAEEHESADPSGIRYVLGDATTTAWWDGEQFDGVVSHMALMDVDDLGGAMATVAAVIRPGGWLTFSVFHPCYPGGPEGSVSGLPSWPPDRGYRAEGRWMTDGEGIRGRVGSVHRMLSTYLNALIGAGFVVDELAEHGASVPTFLVVRATRRT